MKRKVVLISAGLTFAIILAVLFFTNIDDLVLESLSETTSKIQVDIPLQTYEINTECELLYLFFGNTYSMEAWEKFSFLDIANLDKEFLNRKYPDVMAQAIEYGSDPKNIGTILQFRGETIPSEIGDIFSTILMTELSINPKIKPELLRILSGQVSTEEQFLIRSGSHPCEDEIQNKMIKYHVPLNQDLEYEDFYAQAEEKRKEIVEPVKVNYLKMLDGEISADEYIRDARTAQKQLSSIIMQTAEKGMPAFPSDVLPRNTNKSIDNVARSIIIAKLVRDEYSEDEIEKFMELSLYSLFENNIFENNKNTSSTLEKTPELEPQPTQSSMDALTSNASPYRGDKNAPITMVEFGDYQCSFCNRYFHETEPSVLSDYVETGKVKILFKDFTILGTDSVNAAHAAHCASEQGKFWQYHDILYSNWDGENTGWISSENLSKFAENVGLDLDSFSECMLDGRYQNKIIASNNDAETLGLVGTPGFFIIGPDSQVTKISGAQPYNVFKRVFDSELLKQKID